jgi:hypothetical protein
MKVNKKALQLIDKGLSSKTVSKLTESQIDVLHSKLLGEQVTEVPSKTTYKVGPKGGSLPPNQKGYSVRQDPNTKEVIATSAEGELDEEEEVTLDPNKDTETQDPHQVGPSSDDGFGDETDGMGMFEEKKDGPNPWAICHSQVGPKKSRKWERCVREVKKQLKEGKNPVSLFLESQIQKIVEKHIPPRITKGDLLKVLAESEPAVAPPTKPKTKPTTKPNTKPSHPGKNPNPGEKLAPKAGKVSPEDAKDKVIDVIMNLLEK